MIPRHYRPYLRLVAVTVVLVPVAILARSCRFGALMDFVYRTGTREMKRWDTVRDAAAPD
jgi:hypothetical protein